MISLIRFRLFACSAALALSARLCLPEPRRLRSQLPTNSPPHSWNRSGPGSTKSWRSIRFPAPPLRSACTARSAWSEGFGIRDVENHVKALHDTAYRTASIGKAMTATRAPLAEQQKLDLDVPIQKYCPRYPEKKCPVTARDLISHTSGVRHYEGPNVDAEFFNTLHYEHVSDSLDLIKDEPLKQQPGEDIFTTWGYVVLGCVLEGATATGLRRVDAAGDLRSRRHGQHARRRPARHHSESRAGLHIRKGELKNSRWSDMSSKVAAGGWVSTAPDLVRFMNAWMEGRLVSQPTMKLMLEPYKLRSGTSTISVWACSSTTTTA